MPDQYVIELRRTIETQAAKLAAMQRKIDEQARQLHIARKALEEITSGIYRDTAVVAQQALAELDAQ